MAEADVSIVVDRLTDLLKEESRHLDGVSEEIQHLLTELTRILKFLPEADRRLDEQRISNLLREVIDLAKDAKNAVESFLYKASSTGKMIRWLKKNKLVRKIKEIVTRLCFIFDRFQEYGIKSTSDRPESSDSSYITTGRLKRFHSYHVVEPEIYVGSQEDIDSLVGYLVDESDGSYPLISICGMGGLGKTTLAQKIYNHSTVRTYFDALAWVCISQRWQTRVVLQRILISLVHEKREEILEMEVEHIIQNLLEIQRRKKCLIVLDDIWSTEVWDCIKAAFISENSLTKFMLTSRKFKVADYINPRGFIHEVEFLSAEQSWELLKLKALPRGGDYLGTGDLTKMEELGRQMLENCAGLPLAVVILGGIFVTKPSLIEWEKVYHDSLLSQKMGRGLNGDYQRQLADIIRWSHNDLPPQLRPFFEDLGLGPITSSLTLSS